ncbi:MAG: hypothetical protein ABL889_22305 [Terricaulis sp.]
MRVVAIGALAIGLAAWWYSQGAFAQLARAPQPTNVSFTAESQDGMIVVAENAGTSVEAGVYRFVRLGGVEGQEREYIDIDVGAGRGQLLAGNLASGDETHVFHYTLVPPGDYALIFLVSNELRFTSTGTAFVTRRDTYNACLSDAAPIYRVARGEIALVLAPDRNPYDMFRDNGTARRMLLSRFPPGTTIDYLRSPEKAELDFVGVVSANPSLIAQYLWVAPVGALAFDAPAAADLDHCVVGEDLTLSLSQ